MRRDQTPILMYHSIDPSGSIVSVAPETFRFHMESLAERGLRGVSLGDLLDAWRRGAPTNSLVGLTFDDGFANNLDVAAPVLEMHGFSATIFVVAGRLGQDNHWHGQSADIPRLPLLTEQSLAALPTHVFEVGAHTLDHPDLTVVTPTEAERQLAAGRERLEDVLARPVTSFAYPYGRATPHVVECARRLYEASCSTQLAPATAASDRAWLPRIDAYYLRRRALFHRLGTRALSNYLRVRGALRAWRNPTAARPIAVDASRPGVDLCAEPANTAPRSAAP